MTIKEIIASIKSGKTFRATAEDGSFTIKIDRYVPYVCTAIHKGGNLRHELVNKIALDEYERWYEEDLHTDDFIASMPITLVGNDSRFEYELNRKDPIYDETFEKYGFEGNIRIDKSGVSSVLVLNSTKTVVLKAGSKFSKIELQYLAEHEIGVHMLTTMNAANNKLKIFSVGLPVNTMTGEGMAVLLEYLSGNFSMKRLRTLALRVIAVDALCNGADFKSCFATLVNRHKVEKNAAYSIVTRVYRGGGFTKDYLYLNGFSRLFKFWQNGNDLTPLLVGKTSIGFYNTIVEMIDRNIVEKPKFITKSFENPHTEENNILFDYILSGLK